MPSYAKFLKEILSNKKKLEDNDTMTLTAECSVPIENNMPSKLKDPDSFSIPCVIVKFVINKSLCDLGASVYLMPLILEDDEWCRPYMDDSLREFLTLTPNLIPFPKKPYVELKTLPKNLRYEFLDKELEHLVIVNAYLGQKETEQLLDVLRKYPTSIGYNIFDLKGINPSMCMHRIMLEEDSKTSREHQRRINPIMSDVVKREVLKLLEAGIIYPISDSKWVIPVHVIPKKGGVRVVKNDKGEAVEKCVEAGWRMCIDYKKLNKATQKDHLPLPFIDQMLERLAKHSHFCYLDGY